MKNKIPVLAAAAVLLMTACNRQSETPAVTTAFETAAISETTAETATVSETTAETTTVLETTAETATVSETTTETATVSETTAETATVSETTVETTTVLETTAETATVLETTAETATVSETTAETATVLETTAETATVSETTAETTTAPETTAAAEPEVPFVEIEGKRYLLTFEDDFDGDTLDETKWERCDEWNRQDLNNRWEDDMSYLDGKGNLVIEMSYSEEEDKYLSGAVRSKGKFEQAYGYFEICCKINEVPGYWTAFWLMGEQVGNVGMGGRDGTEIDIMESAYYPTGEIQNTIHWDGYGTSHRSLGSTSKADVYDGEFHTFSLLWTKKEYVFYIDGKESWRTNASTAMGTCINPLYMKISAETGSWTAAQGLSPEIFPDYMLVDSVRVYAAEE